MSITVLILDDHRIVRDGINCHLEKETDIEVTAMVPTLAEAMAVLRDQDVTVAVLDLQIPNAQPLHALEAIHQAYPQIGIVAFTMLPETVYIGKAFELGALAYISKTDEVAELIQAIRKAATGERHVPPQQAVLLATMLSKQNNGPVRKALTDREYEVFMGLGAGKTLTQIARPMNVSLKTVSLHRTAIRRKLGLRTPAEVNVEAIRHYLASSQPLPPLYQTSAP